MIYHYKKPKFAYNVASMPKISHEEFFCLSDYAHKQLFQDIQFVWEALDRLETYLDGVNLGQIDGEVSPQAYLVNPTKISVAKGAVIEPGAYLEGPCIIGPGTHVRHGAYVRHHVITGRDCVIGHASELKHSILLDRAAAAHFNYVGDSIVGNDVNLSAGVILANLRLDQKAVSVYFAGQKFVTARKKLGAVIGDASKIGCHSVINPGTLLPKETRCRPNTTIGGK